MVNGMVHAQISFEVTLEHNSSENVLIAYDCIN